MHDLEMAIQDQEEEKKEMIVSLQSDDNQYGDEVLDVKIDDYDDDDYTFPTDNQSD